MNKILILLVLTLLYSCNTKTDEHGHAHEEGGLESLAYIVYSDKSEIFVEFKPLIVGVKSKFAAHFTVLAENFTALSEGTVTISLIMDDKGIKQSANKPSVPGIYRLELQPVKAGIGKLIFDIQTKNYTDQIIIDSVRVYPDEKIALESQVNEGGGGDITFLKEQAWKIEFANKAIKKQAFNEIIKTNGQLLSAPGDEMIVTAKASGIVLFSGNKTIIGSEVKEGTHLFTVASGDFAEGNIEAIYKEAKTNLDKAKADYDRAKELIKDKIISEKDFIEDKSAFENTQIKFATIAKNYTSSGQGISSPIDGYVKNILVSEGQFVSVGSPLATISKNKKLILQANVTQKYFEKLPLIVGANFKANESEQIYGTEELNGKVISYGKSASESSPFIPITFEIDNKGNIIPGSVVEVYLKSSPILDALVVPISALLEEQGNFFVYVQTEGESFQKREVKLGANDGLHVQILSGITEGERVVTKGAYQIKLSSATGTLPAHGHEH